MEKKTLDALLKDFGAAGARLDHLAAVEAGAGNMSACLAADIEVPASFEKLDDAFQLPLAAKPLEGHTVLVTGSGCRLRDLDTEPEVNLSILKVNEGGETAQWFAHPNRHFQKPTSEFNSHLAVHSDTVDRTGRAENFLIHAQPPKLVLLSHIDELRNDWDFNRTIMRWEPETIVQMPQGIKVLEYMVPGSDELMQANVAGLREHRITLWSKHGLMGISGTGLLDIVDKIEYVEAGATYEVNSRMIQAEPKPRGLSDEEIRRVIKAFGVQTSIW